MLTGKIEECVGAGLSVKAHWRAVRRVRGVPESWLGVGRALGRVLSMLVGEELVDGVGRS